MKKEIVILIYLGINLINSIHGIMSFRTTESGYLVCLDENEKLIAQFSPEVFKHNMKFNKRMQSSFYQYYEINLKGNLE